MGPEKASIQLMKGRRERNKKFKGFEEEAAQNSTKIRIANDRLLPFISNQKNKKKRNEAWVGAKFGFHSLLCLAVKCSVKAPVQCPLLSRRHPQLTVLVIVRAVATAASLSYSQQPLLLEFVVLDVVLVFVVYCIGEL